jgi:predicted DsbA family dithiol-disulfide isomerase
MATKEAVAANCARKQGDDATYFKYHDEIFKRTTSNGNGLDDEKIKTIASDIGLNLSQFDTCLQDKAMADEVKKDLADAGEAGASGTPTFIIGKSTQDGTVEGSLVVGAQPFSAFEAVIEPLLK